MIPTYISPTCSPPLPSHALLPNPRFNDNHVRKRRLPLQIPLKCLPLAHRLRRPTVPRSIMYPRRHRTLRHVRRNLQPRCFRSNLANRVRRHQTLDPRSRRLRRGRRNRMGDHSRDDEGRVDET
jgi:hypothetical protein